MALILDGSNGIDFPNAISVSEGGTGLESPGTAGNILTSDGTGWQFDQYNSSNVDAIKVDSLPTPYVNNAWSYSNGKWQVADQSILDAELAVRLEQAMPDIRRQRNTRLQESDVYVPPDRWETYTEEKKQEWKDYRQALRDFPQTVTDPTNVVWPAKPE